MPVTKCGHTHLFDQQVSWLDTQCSKFAVTVLMRIVWPAGGSIIDRAWKDTTKVCDPFKNIKRIGLDQISYKPGHK